MPTRLTPPSPPPTPTRLTPSPKPVLQYVGYSRRGTAVFIDSLWWTLIMLFVPVGPDISLDNPASLLTLFSWATLAWMLFAQCLPAFITGALWATWGTSPGKRLLGLRIVDAATGLPMSSRQVLLRTVGYVICFATMGLGFLPMLVSKRKQGLHDMMANTVVVEKVTLNTVVFPEQESVSRKKAK